MDQQENLFYPFLGFKVFWFQWTPLFPAQE